MTASANRRRKLRLLGHQHDLPMMQRVCFYCRVSTDEQAEQNTIQLQLDYLRSRFRADFDGHGPTPMTFIGEFVDNGWSGAIPFGDRPEGGRALEWARDHKYDVLAVYKVDRLGRTARVLLDAHADLENNGVALTSATEPFDTRPGPMQAFGRFVFQLLGSIAEFERSTIQMRTMDGKLRIAKEGRFINGALPFGFTVTASGILVPSRAIVPELGISESDVIVQLFERITGGESCYGLAEWLSGFGVVTPRRWFNKQHQRVTEDKKSQMWTNRRVWETIRNPVYKGERNLSFGHAEHDQQVEPIVDSELWESANSAMKRSNRTAWGPGRDNFIYLLQRKIRCRLPLANGEQCNCYYTGGGANGYHYYQCNGNDKTQARRRGGLRCGAKMVRSDQLEALIWADLVWQIRNPEQALASTQQVLRDRQAQTITQATQLDELRRRRDDLEVGRRYLRGKLSGRVPRGAEELDEIQQDLDENAALLAGVNEQLMQVESRIETSEVLEQQYAAAVPLLVRLQGEIDHIEQSSDRTAMRKLCDALVSEIRIVDPMNPRTSGIEVRYRFRADNVLPNVSQFTNVMTIVIGGTTPDSYQRRVV